MKRILLILFTCLFSIGAYCQDGGDGGGDGSGGDGGDGGGGDPTVTCPGSGTVYYYYTNPTCSNPNGGSLTIASLDPTFDDAYTTIWSNGETGSSIAGLAEGDYEVVFEDDNGCELTATLSLTKDNVTMTGYFNGNYPYCNNSATNGNLTIVSTNGTGPYDYQWSDGSTGQDLENIPEDNYSVEINDANGCTGTVSIDLTAQNDVTLDVIINDPPQYGACYGEANGAIYAYADNSTNDNNMTYTWSDGFSGSGYNWPLAPGTYEVTITDGNGCSGTGTGTVIQLDPIVAVPTIDNVSCNGSSDGSISLAVTGGTSTYLGTDVFGYTWTPTAADASDIDGLPTGSYSVSIYDYDGGCTQTAGPFEVTQPDPLAISYVSSTNVTCYDGSDGALTIMVQGGTGQYNYSWSPQGPNSNVLTGIPAGDYTVVVTDANNCEQTAGPFSITEPDPIEIEMTSSTDVTCNGGADGTLNIAVTGGTGNYQYSWTPAANGNTSLSGLVSDDYTVVVTDGSGCTQTEGPFFIDEPDPIEITPTTDSVTCHGSSNGAIHLDVTGGTGIYTYSWGGTNADYTGLAAGLYGVTVMDAHQCTAETTANVYEPSAISITMSHADASCNGASDGAVFVGAQGGTPDYDLSSTGYIYLWDPYDPDTESDNTELPAGTYRVTVNDGNGCSAVDSAIVGEPTAIDITTASDSVTCYNGYNGTASVTAVTGGVPGYTYVWLINGYTGPTLTNLIAGDYDVVVYDSHHCSEQETVTVEQPAQITISMEADSVKCKGGSTGSITATPDNGIPPYNYSWNNSIFTHTADSVAQNLYAGEFTVTVYDVNGCSATASDRVYEPDYISLYKDTSVVSCNQANTRLSLYFKGGTPDYDYEWNDGETTSEITDLIPGFQYRLTVTDQNNCTTAYAWSYTAPLIPVKNQNATICAGSIYEYNGHAYTTSGVYADTLTSPQGCDSIVRTTLSVLAPVTSTISLNIYQGNSYDGYTSSGTYIDSFTAINGCDSIRTLHLTVTPAFVYLSLTQSICQGSSYLGRNVTGIYIDTLIATNAPDTIRTLHLTVTPAISSIVSATICQGAAYAGHAASGNYVDHYTSVTGCDSMRSLNLTVLPLVSTSITATICQGTSYAGHSASGTYIDTMTAASGCDSIRTLHLTAATGVTSSITQSICQGSVYAGHSATGMYTDHYTSSGGCDSARTLHLTVTNIIRTSVSQSICAGISYAGHSVAGTYIDTLIAAGGCDSIRTLSLTVKALKYTTLTQSICQGSSYLGRSATGIYIDTLTGVNGCDSIRTLNLTVKPLSYSTIYQTICQGMTYLGRTMTGIYSDTLTAKNGCDSVRTLHLTVLNSCNEWTGAVSTAWNTAGNWSSGTVPNSTGIDVIIPKAVNKPMVSTAVSVRNVQIDSGETLTLNNTISVYGSWQGSNSTAVQVLGNSYATLLGSAKITGYTSFNYLQIAGSDTIGAATGDKVDVRSILNKAAGTFYTSDKLTLVSTAAQTALIQESGGGLSGRITMQRYMSGALGYRELSSPVTDATVATWGAYFPVINPNGIPSYTIHGEGTLEIYNEPANASHTLDSGFYNYTTPTLPLSSAEGFSGYVPLVSGAATIATFGTPLAGALTYPITKTAGTNAPRGWNLVGNPYPSPISWTALKNNNPGLMNGTCYIWKPTSATAGVWQAYNGTSGTNGVGNIISSTQGFFILALQPSASLHFDNSIRTQDLSPVFYKTYPMQENEVRLNLTNLSNPEESDEVVAYTDPSATDRFDEAVDGLKPDMPLDLSGVSIAYHILDEDYSIHVTDAITENTVWPLSMNLGKEGEYLLDASVANTTLPVYLKDNNVNTYLDLKTQSAMIEGKGNKSINHYSIVFKKDDAVLASRESVSIYGKTTTVIVTRTGDVSEPAEVKVYNLLGQEIRTVTMPGERVEIDTDNLEGTIYIVTVKEAGKADVIRKVFVGGYNK